MMDSKPSATSQDEEHGAKRGIESTNVSTTASLASALQGTVIGQLLPQEHRPTWSTNYTVPLYSSFANHLNSYESDTLIGAREVFAINGDQIAHHLTPFDNPLSFGNYHADRLGDSDGGHNSGDFNSGVSVLINRLNRATESDRNDFANSDYNKIINSSSKASHSFQPQHQATADFTARQNRSYSSVLHSSSGQVTSRQPMMQQLRQQQHQSQLSNIFDLHEQQVNDNGGPNMNHTGLPIQPTNPRQQNSLTNHFQFQHHQITQQQQPSPHQQVRHSSDFISSINQQQPHPAYQQYNTVASIGNYGIIGFSSGHRQQNQHNLSTHFNQQRQSIDQDNKPFPGPSGVNAAKHKSKSPFFPNSSSGIGSDPGAASSSSARLDLYGSVLGSSDGGERFSRKVFVGGLPPDIDEEEIKASFRRFGSLVVDWPHKAESKSYFPPKGYAFLLFQEEASVQGLIDACLQEDDKLYLCVSSPTIKDKPVQIRPWRLSDADFVLDSTLALDPRKTVFVGGVPRPLKASELATIMNNLYGNVCYAGIDTDPDLKYPKGAGRVAFSNHQSYIAAISARFVHIHHSEIEKRVEVKPYVLDDQSCDECCGSRCNNKFAPFFCANITCLSYYCDNCWTNVHSQPGRELHKPLVKEGADRPRGNPGGIGGSNGPRNGVGGASSASTINNKLSSGTHCSKPFRW